jgi:small subunit ribosomal protein S16
VAVKIRLKRIGKIRAPQYRVVVADSKTHRDGLVIEEIGRYVPTTDPSIIEINGERAQYWLSVGAQPTEPVMALLKLTGDYQASKGEKATNQVKPQVAKEAFSPDTNKKSVILPKVEKKEEPVAETPAAEAPSEAPAAEAPAEVTEAPATEAAEAPATEAAEAPAEAAVEAAEAPAEAQAEEAPVAEEASEAPAEEAPAAEAAAEEPAAEAESAEEAETDKA